MAAAGAGGEYELSHDKLVKPVNFTRGYIKKSKKAGKGYVYEPAPEKLAELYLGPTDLTQNENYFFTTKSGEEHLGTFRGADVVKEGNYSTLDDYIVYFELNDGSKTAYKVSDSEKFFYTAKTKEQIDNRKEREVTHPAGYFAHQREAAARPLGGGARRNNKRKTAKRRNNKRKTYRKH